MSLVLSERIRNLRPHTGVCAARTRALDLPRLLLEELCAGIAPGVPGRFAGTPTLPDPPQASR